MLLLKHIFLVFLFPYIINTTHSFENFYFDIKYILCIYNIYHVGRISISFTNKGDGLWVQILLNSFHVECNVKSFPEIYKRQTNLQ